MFAATFNEKLLLHNGISVSPLKGQSGENGKEARSLKDAVSAIDNEKDLSSYLASQISNVPARSSEIKYERNPVSLLLCIELFGTKLTREPLGS